MEVNNKQGYQVVFNCAMCGEQFMLEDMHYINPGDYRLCNSCFEKWTKIPNKIREAQLEAEQREA